MRKRKGQTDIKAEAGAKRGQPKWERWEILAAFGSVLLFLYIWIFYENFHFHVTHFYARLGYPNAQHLVGQRYLRGIGVAQDPQMASHWFRRAAHNALSLAREQNRTMIAY